MQGQSSELPAGTVGFHPFSFHSAARTALVTESQQAGGLSSVNIQSQIMTWGLPPGTCGCEEWSCGGLGIQDSVLLSADETKELLVPRCSSVKLVLHLISSLISGRAA